MGSYGNGDETKAQIICACEKLFFEKGYAETTFLDICKEAHVNQGSIYYHFKEKQELFRQVSARINEHNRAVARQVLPPDAAPLLLFLVDTYVYWYRFYTDAQFRQFMSTPAPSSSKDMEHYRRYWEQCSSFIPDFDRFFEEHTLDFIISTDIDRQMATYTAEHLEDYTWQELAEYQLQAVALLFKVSPERIEQLLQKTRELLKDVDFQEYFP